MEPLKRFLISRGTLPMKKTFTEQKKVHGGDHFNATGETAV